MSAVVRNQDGIALVITLLVVALLTIIVVEFTYSVEIDQHMARNALNGLQASLLARSGINLGEAFLLHDDDATVDAYTEDWGNLDALNSQFVLPDNMRLRVQIVDESGKLNINMTRPPNISQLRQAQATNGSQTSQIFPFQSWTNALGNLIEARGGDPQIVDGIAVYWQQALDALIAAQPGGISGTAGVSTAAMTAGAQASQNAMLPLTDFPSLDDAAVVPGFTPALIRRLRAVATALPPARQPKVNANTASREVLTAIVGDGGVVDNIISQRQEEGLKEANLGQLLASLGGDPATRNARIMLGVRSSYFLIRASAVVNPNPITGRGGISRSASMLVMRYPRPGVPQNAPAGTPRWTLTQLDWQKEGGAALFQKADHDTGVDDPSIPAFPES
jgi:general secretion pathway protein K